MSSMSILERIIKPCGISQQLTALSPSTAIQTNFYSDESGSYFDDRHSTSRRK